MPPEQREHIAQGVKRAHERGYAPRLPRGHGLSREARDEWSMWHHEGYADAWSGAQTAQALELLRLIDAQRRLTITDAALLLRMSRQVHQLREDLDLLRPSPAAERQAAEHRSERKWRDYLATPSYSAMTDDELRRQGCPEHLIAERQAPAPELAA
jgi:hypothetical protein